MARDPSAFKDSCLVDDTNRPSRELALAILPSQNAVSPYPNPKTANASLESLRRTSIARVSSSPASSSRSKLSGAFHSGTENLFPSRNTSHTTLHSCIREESHVVESTVGQTPVEPVQKTKQLPHLLDGDYPVDINPGTDTDQLRQPHRPKSRRLSIIYGDHEAFINHSGTELGPQASIGFSEEEGPVDISPYSNCSPYRETGPRVIITSTPPKALKRIADSVRRRHVGGPDHLKPSEERQDLGDEFEPRLESVNHLEVSPKHVNGQHRKASSGFSSIFVTNHKRAAKDTSSSSGNVSSQKSHRSRVSTFSLRSSRLSSVANRTSTDSDQESRPTRYKASVNRALQRRRIIGELINSETGYLNDLRILTYVYLAILGSTQTFEKDRLTKVEDNMLSIIALHEDLLAGMKSVTQSFATPTEGRRTFPRVAKHIRYGSIDSAKTVQPGHKSLKGWAFGNQPKEHGPMAEPKEAADIAGLFAKMLGGAGNTQMGKFSVYEEYGAKYAEMLQACASASRSIPIWEVVERSIEALVNKVLLQGAVAKEDRKALTFEDLLIKPIQRICKYPLLFAELESYCPAIDDPDSNVTITKILDRLRETAHEVNNATNDVEAQARLRRSQNLEDLLRFPDAFRPSFSLMRDLGHAKLCGVLFVAYQARSGGIGGDFMLCALFNSYMLLASSEPGYKRFIIDAIIGLDTLRLDSACNGGLQCHETPYAWKIIFEADDQLYEILICACNELEAERWKTELQDASSKEIQRHHETGYSLGSNFKFLSLEVMEHANRINGIGSFRQGRLVRPFAKSTPRIQAVPIIIKNTYVPIKGDHTESQSNSAMSTSRLHTQGSNEISETLVPERSHRTRMEQAMSEVWTRATIPFPGMTTSRSGQLIRASASMMRKLSKTSIASTPSKRSISQRSRASTMEICLDGAMDDPFVDHPITSGQHVLESADVATEMPVFYDQPKAKYLRKVSFSDDLMKPGRTCAQDDGSETSTVVGTFNRANSTTIIGSTNEGNNKEEPKRTTLLSKALSRERIKGWFS